METINRLSINWKSTRMIFNPRRNHVVCLVVCGCFEAIDACEARHYAFESLTVRMLRADQCHPQQITAPCGWKAGSSRKRGLLVTSWTPAASLRC